MSLAYSAGSDAQSVPAGAIKYMKGSHFSRTVEISAPPPVVWSVMADVERWPEWTASISRIELSPGPLQVGSRARVYQPQLPRACWRVTKLEPKAGFTWVSTAPGVRVTGTHTIEPSPSGCRVTLSIDYAGLFGPLLARWTGALTDRYLALEANGLKARCVALAAQSC